MNRTTFGLLAVVLATSCLGESPPPDDAGDAQWVLQAIPTLLGRSAKSTLEVQALTDITIAHGREAAANAIMGQPEFSRYWALVLLEDMKLDGIGTNPLDKNCVTDYTLNGLFPNYPQEHFDAMGSVEAVDLIRHVIPGASRTSTTEQNSLSKLVEAAVHQNRLDVTFAAHMPILASTHGENNAVNLRIRFTERVLNRDLDCLACHNGEWSVTDDVLERNVLEGGWDRSFNAAYTVLEGNLFDHVANGQTISGVTGDGTVKTNLEAFLGLEQWDTASSDAIFGLKNECFTRTIGGVNHGLNLQASSTNSGHFAGLSGQQTILDVTDHFLSASQNLGTGTLIPFGKQTTREYSGPPAGSQGLAHSIGPLCMTCHASTADPSALDPGFAHIPDWRIREVLTTSWPTAMDGYTCGVATDPDACADDTIAWIRDPSRVPYEPLWEFDTPQTGLGMGIAFQVVDHIVEEVSGSRLTLEHGFARNIHAAELQRELGYTLVNSGWSLRAVLRHMVLSDAFNRNAPEDSAAATLDDHYVLAQVAKPLLEQQPMPTSDPDYDVKNHKASLGDSIHRRSTTQLIERVHHALGWASSWSPGRDPEILALGNAYPNPELLRELGRFDGNDHPGWTGAILPSQLAWEHAFGSCEKPLQSTLDPQMSFDPNQPTPSTYAPGSALIDWLDVATAEAIAGQWPVSDALALTKERLLSDPVIGASEAAAIQSVAVTHGVGSLTSTADTLPAGALEALLRDYCGALLTSPQFMLNGIATTDADQALGVGATLPPRPAFQRPTPIANPMQPMEPLTVADWCDEYGYELDATGACTVFNDTFSDPAVDSLLTATDDAVGNLKNDVPGAIAAAGATAPGSAIPDLESALDEVLGQNMGLSQDGAVTKFASGLHTSGMIKLNQTVDHLIAAKAEGCDCDEAIDTTVVSSMNLVSAILKDETAAGTDPADLEDKWAAYDEAVAAYHGGSMTLADDDREAPAELSPSSEPTRTVAEEEPTFSLAEEEPTRTVDEPATATDLETRSTDAMLLLQDAVTGL